MTRKPTVEIVFFEDITFQVEVSIARAEPDVGIASDYIEEWHIVRVDDCKDAQVIDFFTNKIEGHKRILESWMDQLNDKMDEARDCAMEER